MRKSRPLLEASVADPQQSGLVYSDAPKRRANRRKCPFTNPENSDVLRLDQLNLHAIWTMCPQGARKVPGRDPPCGSTSDYEQTFSHPALTSLLKLEVDRQTDATIAGEPAANIKRVVWITTHQSLRCRVRQVTDLRRYRKILGRTVGQAKVKLSV